jgi:hypothetical protein
VRPAFAVQICTPGVLAPTVHSRTSCSMHGQLELMASFHAHSLGEPVRHVALLACAQSGTLTVQSAVPAQPPPPQCSLPTVGGGGDPHSVKQRKRGAKNINENNPRFPCLVVIFGFCESPSRVACTTKSTERSRRGGIE